MKTFVKDYEMNTSIMEEYRKLGANKALNMFYDLADMEAKICDMKLAAEKSYLYFQIKEVIEEFYDIGTVKEIYEIFGGYVNRSFGIYTEKDGQRQTWFFRKYMRNKDLNELILEHKLLTYARAQGFDRGALPIPGKDGNTYYDRDQKMENGEYEKYYFAVYEFIEGDPAYDWINNKMAPASYNSIAGLLAELHNATRDFDPEKYERAESRIDGLMREWPTTFQNWSDAYAKAGVDNEYTQYFAAELPYIKSVCKDVSIPEEDLKKMPVCPLQCDFHPGNVKYDKDLIVTGIYDFDWAKMDIRLFEFGLGMVYFFSSWDAASNGVMDMDGIVEFINTYNEELRKLGGLSPIGELEKKYLYELLIMGNMYLVKWCSEAFYLDMTLPSYEYRYYMQHQVSGLKWLQNNEEAVRALIEKIK